MVLTANADRYFTTTFACHRHGKHLQRMSNKRSGGDIIWLWRAWSV